MLAADYPYFAGRFLALAHRGGRTNGPDSAAENSLAAFAQAAALGYTHMETDVHTTADGVLVAFHDNALDRVTDASGALAELPWDEVKQARIAGTEPIPTLDDLLDAFPSSCFNIDLKADGAVEPLARTIARHSAEDRVCVASFSGARLRRFRALAGTAVATSVAPAGIGLYALGVGIRRAIVPDGVALQIPVKEERTGIPVVTGGLIEAAHAHGRTVHVWTINDAEEMHRLIDMGVDGLVSDDVVTCKAVLMERNLWETS